MADYGPCCGKITEPRNYLPGALVADDDGRDWMIPIPAPPIAPASSPTRSGPVCFRAMSSFSPFLSFSLNCGCVCLYFSKLCAVPSEDITIFRVIEIRGTRSRVLEGKCKLLHLQREQSIPNVESHRIAKLRIVYARATVSRGQWANQLMRTIKFYFLITMLSAVCLTAQAQDQKDPNLPNSFHTIAIRAALLIDGKSDTAIPDAVILIDGEKITAVGSRLPVPAGATVIDLGDSILLPGLIDAHTHLLLEMDGRNVSLQDVEMLKVVATEARPSVRCWEPNSRAKTSRPASRPCAMWATQASTEILLSAMLSIADGFPGRALSPRPGLLPHPAASSDGSYPRLNPSSNRNTSRSTAKKARGKRFARRSTAEPIASRSSSMEVLPTLRSTR